MKLQIFILCLFASSCCIVTSRDCGCIPPDPELKEETLKWIEPYNEKNFFVFENEIGVKDTLHILRLSVTEICGGDECSSDCEVEKVLLISLANPELGIAISATRQKQLIINDNEDSDTKIFVSANVVKQEIHDTNLNVAASIINDFMWDNEKRIAMIMSCEDEFSCSSFNIKSMVMSRDLGLLSFQTKQNESWKRIIE